MFVCLFVCSSEFVIHHRIIACGCLIHLSGFVVIWFPLRGKRAEKEKQRGGRGEDDDDEDERAEARGHGVREVTCRDENWWPSGEQCTREKCEAR